MQLSYGSTSEEIVSCLSYNPVDTMNQVKTDT